MVAIIKYFLKLVAATTIVMVTVMTSFLVLMLGLSAVIASTVDMETTSGLLSDKEFVFGSEKSANTLLAIDINGLILGEREITDPWLSGFDVGITYGYEIKDMLIEAADDPSIKGVLLVTNSPGGTIFGSQAILDGVEFYQNKTGNPVLAFVSGVAASGSYWAILPSDEIIADKGTMVGSIGIIYGPFKYYDTVTAEDGGLFSGGVITERGIQTTYITAGRSKDLGNPYRQLTAEETTSLQRTVNESYAEFVALVSKHRAIPAERVAGTIGALVYGEHSARRENLIDAIGSREQSFLRLAQKAGVENSFKIMRVKKEYGFWESVFAGQLLPLQQNAAQTSPSTRQVCTLSSTILAFHGDPQSLCQ